MAKLAESGALGRTSEFDIAYSRLLRMPHRHATVTHRRPPSRRKAPTSLVGDGRTDPEAPEGLT
jgi:hypothetical protein